MKMRTKVYSSVLQLLADRRWHHVYELRQVTSYPDDWLKELRRDPLVEVVDDRMRLRTTERDYATA